METQTQPHDEASLTAALETLRAGGVVAVPTETVYGLAGDATNADAVASIYAAKGRPSHNPLIAHIADLAMGEHYAAFSDMARALADAFWPGPLTMVLPLEEDAGLAPAVTAGGKSLAVRCPRGALGELAQQLGRPLAAPSANRSGHVSPTTAMHVQDDLGGRIPLILDGGTTQIGLESTIIDMRAAPKLLRAGALDIQAIEAALKRPVAVDLGTAENPVAPGQLASHYAPNALVRLNVLPGDVRFGEVYLGFGKHRLTGQPNLSAAGNLAEAAAGLYGALRDADARGPASIAVAPIPQDGLGAAINDRLKRAAVAPPK